MKSNIRNNQKVIYCLILIFISNISVSSDTIKKIVLDGTINGDPEGQVVIWEEGSWVNRTAYHDTGTDAALVIYKTITAGVDSDYQLINDEGYDSGVISSSAAWWYFNADPIDAKYNAYVDSHHVGGFEIKSRDPLYPDLIVKDIYPETDPLFKVGQQVQWRCEVENDVPSDYGTAGQSDLGYYIGTSSTDLSNRWEQDGCGTIEAGASSNENEYYTFQESDIGTNIYIICKADYENNNLRAYGPFTVEDNAPIPSPPLNLAPENYAANISISTILSWENGGYATSYNIYFSTVPTNLSLVNIQTNTVFNPWILNYGTMYYWRIDAINEAGITISDVWSFQTSSSPEFLIPEIQYELNKTSMEENDWSTIPGGFVENTPTGEIFSYIQLNECILSSDDHVGIKISVSHGEIVLIHSQEGIQTNGYPVLMRMLLRADNVNASIALTALKGNLNTFKNVDGSIGSIIPSTCKSFLGQEKRLILIFEPDEGDIITPVIQVSSNGSDQEVNIDIDKLEIYLIENNGLYSGLFFHSI
jgi:hypothetical protein